jgi:hypothetical protein
VLPNANESFRARGTFRRSLLRDLCRLLRSWWRIDRVRVPPREGELLHLKVGDVVVVERCVVQVTSRRVVESSGGAAVIYRCATESQTGWLAISTNSCQSPQIALWRFIARVVEVSVDEIEVFAR